MEAGPLSADKDLDGADPTGVRLGLAHGDALECVRLDGGSERNPLGLRPRLLRLRGVEDTVQVAFGPGARHDRNAAVRTVFDPVNGPAGSPSADADEQGTVRGDAGGRRGEAVHSDRLEEYLGLRPCVAAPLGNQRQIPDLPERPVKHEDTTPVFRRELRVPVTADA